MKIIYKESVVRSISEALADAAARNKRVAKIQLTREEMDDLVRETVLWAGYAPLGCTADKVFGIPVEVVP